MTEADLAAEKLIIERIKSHIRAMRFLLKSRAPAMEELGGEIAIGSGSLIRSMGTTNYAHGYPCFCVSIAVEHAGAIELGVVYESTAMKCLR